jgi:8-oxo-dGTP pyrophosphatase MutT (NUDIX family)
VEIRPSVAVVALNHRDEIALVGQWRYALERYSWEIPRGGSRQDDSGMLAAARRELREETGLMAASWKKLAAVDLNNGVTTSVEHVFLATGLTATGTEQDPEEQIVTRWVPFADSVRMAMSGEITECSSVAAILMVALSKGGAR